MDPSSTAGTTENVEGAVKKAKEQFKPEAGKEDERHNKWAAGRTDADIKKLAENTARYMKAKEAKKK